MHDSPFTCSREASRERLALIQLPFKVNHNPSPGLCRLPAGPAAPAEVSQAGGRSYGAFAEMPLAGKRSGWPT